jgi:transcriptional regulator with XRE-family HTH domain
MASHRRTYSPLTTRALAVLGKRIRLARRQRRMSETDLAARIGIARSTLQLIERGDPKVEIGSVFEAATIAGVDLFALYGTSVSAESERIDDKLAALPKRIRRTRKEVDDDF